MSRFLIAEADALEFMVRLTKHPRRYDAIITDPPFPNTRASRAGAGTSKHEIKIANVTNAAMSPDGLSWTMRHFGRLAAKLLMPTGSLLMFADLGMLRSLPGPIESGGLWLRNVAIWDKCVMGTGVGFRMEHEYILHFVSRDPKFHDRGTPSVLGHPRVSDKHRHHENEKPIALLKRLVKLTSPPDGWVLDPFAGSFNVGFACHKLGGNFVGCDVNPAHVAAAKARYAAIVNAPTSAIRDRLAERDRGLPTAAASS